MNRVKMKEIILKASVFSFAAGSIFSAIGIYTGGLDTLVMPDILLNILSYVGVVL